MCQLDLLLCKMPICFVLNKNHSIDNGNLWRYSGILLLVFTVLANFLRLCMNFWFISSCQHWSIWCNNALGVSIVSNCILWPSQNHQMTNNFLVSFISAIRSLIFTVTCFLFFCALQHNLHKASGQLKICETYNIVLYFCGTMHL